MINKSILAFFALIFFIVHIQFVHAQDNSLTLSVTPTLFEMTAVPGQNWRSRVKVINSNRHPLTVYADIVNFAPQGELGQGKFLPVFETLTEGSTLAEWITSIDEPVVIPAQQSVEVPIEVQVPEDAAPGGHFAAIMIGTQPPPTSERFQVQTSQIVTSLFFVRIAGDVVENGSIREFKLDKKFLTRPEATFEVRFENKGNVHILPQGQIEITNMWGKQRGLIPINHQTHFGNVLPESIRKFEFAWEGEQSLTDIGKYEAALTLGYGYESRKTVSSVISFWVIPVKALSVVLGSIAVFVVLIVFLIKLYVRRMLSLAGVQPTYRNNERMLLRAGDVLIERKTSVTEPVRAGVTDLLLRLKNAQKIFEKLTALYDFVVAYKFFFVGSTLVLFFIYLGFLLFADVTTEQKNYQVTIDNEDKDVTLSSEEILYEQSNTENTELRYEELESQTFDLTIVNSSESPGLAGILKDELKEREFVVKELKSDFEASKEKTVIVYSLSEQETALTLSQLLNNALLSALPQSEETERPQIIIYLGNDYAAN